MGSDEALKDLEVVAGDSIDIATFEQILEMDDDEDDREFSRGIVFNFFEQVETTFTQMWEALDDHDLPQLSSLGHFLKGSSATLGLNHMKQSCEKIQNLGHGKDETGEQDKDNDSCLRAIREELKTLKAEYNDVERGLRRFYGEN